MIKFIIKSILVLLLICSTKTLNAQLPSNLDDATLNSIDSIVNLQMNSLTGLSVGIVYDGEFAYARGYGDRDTSGGLFLTTTKTVIASVSKIITGVLAMKLVEEGHIALTDQVTSFVTSAQFSGMTIQHLLNHQSGIDHYGTCPTGYNGEFERDSSLAIVQGCTNCMIPPGSGTLYTTHGMTLLGAIIDTIGKQEYGKSYIELYQDWIQTPAGLTALEPAFDDSDPELSDGFASNGNFIQGGWSDIGWRLPAGGFISDILSLAKFAKGLVNNTFMTLSTLDSMAVLQTPLGGANFLCNNADASDRGLAFRINTAGGITRLWHNGLNEYGYSAYLMIYPDNNAAVVMLANEANETTRLNTIRQAIEPLILCPSSRSFTAGINWENPDSFTAGSTIQVSTFVQNYPSLLTLDAGNFVRFLPGATLVNGREVYVKTGGCP